MRKKEKIPLKRRIEKTKNREGEKKESEREKKSKTVNIER